MVAVVLLIRCGFFMCIYRLDRSVTNPSEPVVYYLLDDPERGVVCEELIVELADTQLPPDSVLTR